MSLVNKDELTAAVQSGKISMECSPWDFKGSLAAAITLRAGEGGTILLRRFQLGIALLLEEASATFNGRVDLHDERRIVLVSEDDAHDMADVMQIVRRVVADVSSKIVWERHVDGTRSRIVRTAKDDCLAEQQLPDGSWKAVEDWEAVRILCAGFCEVLDLVGDLTRAAAKTKA